MLKGIILSFAVFLLLTAAVSELTAAQVDRKPFEVIKATAESGDADSQYELGRRYYTGDGTAKNLAEAIKWVRKAAENGLAIAQGALGAHYFYGEGVTKDNTEA